MEVHRTADMASGWPQPTSHVAETEWKSINPVTVADFSNANEKRRASLTNSQGRPKANYRPVSLRWWYIVGLILAILGVAGVVIYGLIALRGTKSTGVVETRSLVHDDPWRLHWEGLEKRQESIPSDGPPTIPAATNPAATGAAPTGSAEQESNPPIEIPTDKDLKLTTEVVETSVPTFTSTGPPTILTFTTDVMVTSTIEFTTTSVSVRPASTIFFGPPPPPEDSTEDSNTSGAAQQSSSSVIPASTFVFESTGTKTEEYVTAMKTTSVQEGKKYVQYGKTRISSTYTVDQQGRKVEGAVPVTSVITKEVNAKTISSIEQPRPTTFETIGVDGLPTKVTSMLQPITHVSTVPPSKITTTMVATPTASGDRLVVETFEYELSPARYFIGKFLPPLVSVLLVLAIRAVDLSAKLYQPFVALSHPRGAWGRDSLTLHFEGWKGFWRPFALLTKGHTVPFFSTLAVWLSSAALTPVATEAIRLDIQGRCKARRIDGCAVTLGIAPKSAYVLLGLLGLIALLLVSLMIAMSRRWRTGVFADPWCVAGAAALVRNPDVRAMVSLDDWKAVKAATTERRFCLGWYRRDSRDLNEEYGLVLCDEEGRSLRGSQRYEASVAMMRDGASNNDGFVGLYGNDTTPRQRKPPATFIALTVWWRTIFLIYMLALTGFIIYYQLGINVPESFEDFVQEEKFGRRFVASFLGIIVVLCWECVFDSIAILAPYRRMARGPKKASLSILAGRPIYAVTGIFTGIRERDLLLFGTALMAVMADFLPMLFANVPYDLTQTEMVHLVCARLSAGLLLLMSLVLVLSMFAKWPELPVDPRSIAGQMWYVAEAQWPIDKLEGSTLMLNKERKELLNTMGGKWYYGATRTEGRTGVEMEDTYGLMEYDGLRPYSGQARGTISEHGLY